MPFVSAKEPISWWGTGKLVEVCRHGETETYTIQNRMCRLTGRRSCSSESPKVAVGEMVKYSEAGKSLYIVDERGKVFKLQYIRQQLMPPISPPLSLPTPSSQK
jgi:hypothetical protein